MINGLRRHGAEVISALVLSLSVVCTIYIMIHNIGLDDSLDFGAGAYYYADMPGFEKWTDKVYYISQFPSIVIILLFLVWGAVMYWLWIWLDIREEKKS
ncbi:MAG: hypothetical protein IJT02_09485 [Synergistaceae bacterium]|nr:hypothetical protein [Synergistaceae bacterium]